MTRESYRLFKMNFPEIMDIAPSVEGVFHDLVFVSIKKTHGICN